MRIQFCLVLLFLLSLGMAFATSVLHGAMRLSQLQPQRVRGVEEWDLVGCGEAARTVVESSLSDAPGVFHFPGCKGAWKVWAFSWDAILHPR